MNVLGYHTGMMAGTMAINMQRVRSLHHVWMQVLPSRTASQTGLVQA